MAALSHSESRRLYSWWWDSHISPKNSKWLQENLTDMDQKVKGMIKLLEQDGDSFARKAEMYFKNRPELLKLVEEFYRAYRALAERYDHATGALRQAHKTMAEVFPDQDDLDEDSPLGSSETDPHTPETLHPLRAKLDPDDLHKDAIGISSPRFKLPKKGGAYSNEVDSLTGTKGLKQLNDLFGSREGAPRYVKFGDGRMRKGLNYREEDRSDNMTENGQSLQFGISKQNRRPPLKSEQASKVENEVQTLKNSLAKVEAEKDAGFLQYQHALERLSELEAKVSRAQEDSRECSERSSRAEAEVQALHEALTRLQKEKEDGLLQYHQCAEMMSNLENKMSHSQKDSQFNAQDIKSESDPESLKQALARVEAERDASLIQYSQSLEKISKLESQVSLAEENARNLNERAVRAENEVQLLKEAIVKAGEEKESALLQYQRSLETISVLQTEVSHAHEEVRRLSNVLVMGVAQLNSTEEQYLQLQKENLSLQTEVDNLLEMMEIQKQELSEKNEEIERLQIDIEEEYVRSMEAEEALQSLQDVHSECPEEHRAFVLDSQHSDERLIDMELEHQIFAKIEAWSPKEGHKTLNERRSLSPGLAETNLQDEIIRLREAGAELDKEVEVLVDQKNELQQEIHTLKEEINDLKTRHLIIVGQLEQVGLEPDCLGSSVKSLQDENSRLADICEKDRVEKISLWEKLKDMENILEKNALLENSLTEVNAAVELLREKVKELEDICQLLKRVNSGIVAEKEYLISQLAIANGKAEKLSEKNTHLQNFLYDASVERDWLREKSNSLEGICQSLTHEKLELVTVNNNVVSEFKSIQQKLHDLSRKYTDLEVKSSDLEKERESTAHQVKELQSNLALVRQEYSSFMSSSEAQLAHLEEKNHILQEESKRVMIKFEDEQDKAVLIQLEIFILQRCIKEMEERNRSLFTEYQKQLETSNLSEHRARSLELENFVQQVKANSLFDEVQTLRSGIRQMASSLKVNQAHKCQAEIENDNLLLHLSLRKVEDLETSLWLTQDEKHRLLFENSVLLTLFSQLRLTAAGIKSDSIALDRDLKLRTEDLLLLQSERNILKSESDHLNQQFGVWEETLSRKGMELIETERNLEATKTENAELYRKLENTNRECDEARLRISVLELHNLSNGETNLHQHEEINRLHKVIEKLELEMGKLHKEIQEGRVREDFLSSEVQQIKSKLKLWEHEAEALYSKWQIADTHAVLFEQKLRELAGVCVSVEDERILNVQAIAQMKERVRVLELENKGTKSDLAAYLPAVASLNDSVTLLEDHVFSATEEQADNHEIEAANSSSNLQDNTNKEISGDQSLMVVDGVSNLLALQTRIKKIENSVIEQKKLQMKENFERNIKLDAAIREIQKFEQSGRTLHNTDPESSMKDIPLDQVSHSSSYDRHTMSKRQDFNRSSEILEIWETEEKDFELDLTFEQKSEPVALEGNSEYCSSDIQSEDWSSKSMTIPMSGGGKKKILERLASDAQKLMNLLLAVQDLKKTAQGLEKFKTPKNDTELDRVKAEIDELEEAIMQLSGTNGKLSKRAETNYELEETEKARKNRVSERARRSSEKIGRLQIEVQRIQFVLARLDNKYKGKDRKVLLKDYLYGNLRSPLNMKQRKKPQLFSCVKLKTKW